MIRTVFAPNLCEAALKGREGEPQHEQGDGADEIFSHRPGFSMPEGSA